MLRPELLDELAVDGGPDCDVRDCPRPALFAVLTSGAPIAACAGDLGSILTYAGGVLWPPRLTWLGTGEAPPSAHISTGHGRSSVGHVVRAVLGSAAEIASRIA
jgi:hypothetical protein